jgi:hypothetical protein
VPPRVLFGDSTEISKALRPQTDVPSFIPMGVVLRCLRGNAAKAGIQLPEKLTVDPNDKPAYDKWRAEIDAYREAAGVRVAKAKTPA